MAERFIYSDAQNTVAATDDDARFVTYKLTMRYPVDTPREISSKLPEIYGSSLAQDTGNTVTFTEGKSGLTGKWILKLQCPNANVYADSANLNAWASAWDVQIAIWNTCKDYYYKVFVTRIETYNTDAAKTSKGISYTISYDGDGIRVDVPELQVAGATASDTVTTLHYGGATSNLPTYTIETLWDAAQDHLFFNPAPYDWFYTPHAVP